MRARRHVRHVQLCLFCGVRGDVFLCPRDADGDTANDGVCGDVDSCPADTARTTPTATFWRRRRLSDVECDDEDDDSDCGRGVSATTTTTTTTTVHDYVRCASTLTTTSTASSTVTSTATPDSMTAQRFLQRRPR